MSTRKLRTAIVVFAIGFALGLSVFGVSRLVVRSVLAGDAIEAATEFAARLAAGETAETIAAHSRVVRYAVFDEFGRVDEAIGLGLRRQGGTEVPADIARLARSTTGAVVIQSDLLPSLVGLAEPSVRSIAVPVLRGEERIATLYAEVDQSEALASLTRAFSLAAMIAIALAVLAVVMIAFVMTRGRGFGSERKPFDPEAHPHDTLTGLLSRNPYRLAIEDAIAAAGERDLSLALMIFELRGLRAINDAWGHAVGDMVIVQAAKRLRTFASGEASLARLDGNEFGLLVAKDADASGMRALGEKVAQSLNAPYDVDGKVVTLDCRTGIALYPVNADSSEGLHHAASVALSRARMGGASKIRFYDTQMAKAQKARSLLERDLRHAIAEKEFVVFYQPQLELRSGKLRGYEALVRWERPQHGLVSPREFLSLAEESGLIHSISEWVLERACADAASWLDAGKVSVNFCRAQLQEPNLDKKIAAILAKTGLAPERLEIEIPEAAFLEQTDRLNEILPRIKALGVAVAIDDFGADYAKHAAFADVEFDAVKIDRSFVGQLQGDADSSKLVASIVGLAQSLSGQVTAEGVETNDQVTLLRAAGCSIAQGFLFGAPRRSVEPVPDAISAQGGRRTG